jgi:hypothetical protein
MVPVFACPVLATPTRAFVPDTLPGLARSALRVDYVNYSDSGYVYLKYYHYSCKNYDKISLLNDDTDHDNMNLIDFIYNEYITNDIISHDYSALTVGYIDIGNKGYHLTFRLCSSQTICDAPAIRVTTDPTAISRVGHIW